MRKALLAFVTVYSTAIAAQGDQPFGFGLLHLAIATYCLFRLVER